MWRWLQVLGRNLSRFYLVVAFGFTYFALEWAYQGGRGEWLQKLIVDDITVRSSAFLIQQFTPAEQVTAQGHLLKSPFGGLNILNGCEGTEVLFLLIAAIVSFPGGVKAKLAGVGWAALLTYVLNQIRIVVLYYAWRHDQPLFQMIHGVIAPTIIVILSSLFFLSWAKNANSIAAQPVSN